MPVSLIEIDYPRFGRPEQLPEFELDEYNQRLLRTRTAMARGGLTHLAVHGDREHFANLRWLTGFDPRFEEALLILAAEAGAPMLLVGVECDRYVEASPLKRAGALRHTVFDAFSLPDMPVRKDAPSLEALLGEEGIDEQSRVGVVGWKPGPLNVPAHLVDALRAISGADRVSNASGLFTNPTDGLRTSVSAAEIAWFEYSNVLASSGMERLLGAAREGAVDYDVVAEAGYGGFPLGCHWGLKTAGNRVSLSSPNGSRLVRGGPFSANICYWGANCCRAGWAADSEQDLPPAARDYVDAFAGPYFEAMAEWFSMLTIGRAGGDIFAMIARRLPFERFGIALSPGHLIHFDEWIGSPIYEDSTVPVRSGMVFQADVIPSNATYYSTRMEDTYAVADATLRAELRAAFPDCWERIGRRREFMNEVLGIGLPEEVLPLSNLCGIVPPFVFRPERVLALR